MAHKAIRNLTFFTGLFLLLGLAGCKHKVPEVKQPSKLIHDSCTSDQSIKYTIYIPSHVKSCAKLPIVFLLDPHGATKSVISRFTPIGEKYGCILVSTYSVRNDIPDFIPLIQQVISDVRSKYPTDNNLYLAGFSGGARMAIAYAQENTVNGLVVCGALASDEDIRNCKTNLFAVAGMVDFNFGESARFVLNPRKSPDNLFLEINDDVHEWPPQSTLERAFGAVFLSNPPENHDCFPLKELSKNYLSIYSAYCDSLIKTKEFMKTALALSNLQHLNLSGTGSAFGNRLDTLFKNKTYRNQIHQLQNSLMFEYRVREAYQQALMKKDASWWSNELMELNKQIKTEKNTYQRLALRRIKAFLGIMCYTLSRNEIQQKDYTGTLRMLKIYKLVDPKNPDMFYFSALYALKTGEKPSKVKDLLQQSLDNGYSDMKAVHANFPSEITKGFTRPKRN